MLPVVLAGVGTSHLDPVLLIIEAVALVCARAVLPRRAAEVAELGAAEASSDYQFQQDTNGLGVIERYDRKLDLRDLVATNCPLHGPAAFRTRLPALLLRELAKLLRGLVVHLRAAVSLMALLSTEHARRRPTPLASHPLRFLRPFTFANIRAARSHMAIHRLRVAQLLHLRLVRSEQLFSEEALHFVERDGLITAFRREEARSCQRGAD